MAETPIPEAVGAFIGRYIGSVAELEALLLLCGQTETWWDSVTVAGRLYVTDAAAAEILAQLRADGLATADAGRYRYDPATPELRDTVERLAETYSRYLIPVTNMIHHNPLRLRRFADAFRFRKD